MAAILSKYNTALTIRFPLVKVATQNFAVAADYTHASGDVKVTKDGGVAATATNAPAALTMGNGAIWTLVLTATEMSAQEVVVTVIDAVTKAVEDQAIIIHTYGNASAMHPFDLGTALASQTVGTATNVTTVNGLAANVITATAIATDAIDDDAIATGAIASTAFAAGAINAAAIAADAIGASELAADAVTEIGAGVWNAVRASHTTAGSFGEGAASVQGNVTGTVASVTGAVGSVTGAVGSVTGNVGGNVVGSTASVTGAVGSVTGNVTGSVGSLATQAKADAKTQVVDALSVDTYAELTDVPAATSTLKDKLTWLFMLARNRVNQTATVGTIYADNATTALSTTTVSDNGTTFERGEWTP